MKRYFHKTLNGYFIERNGTFYMNTGDGVEMELAYRPPVERMLADGILIEQPTSFTSASVDDTYNDTAEVSVTEDNDGNQCVYLDTGDMMFEPSQARALAKALIEAAEVAEVLNAD